MPVSADVEAELDGLLANSVRESADKVALVMAIAYGSFAVFYGLDDANPVPPALVVVTSLTSALAAACGLRWLFVPPSAEHAQAKVACLGLLAIANVTLYFAFQTTAEQSGSYLPIIMACGCFLLSRRWLAIVLTLAWISWLTIVSQAPGSWSMSGTLVFTGTLLAFAFQSVRIEATRGSYLLRVSGERDRQRLKEINAQLELTQFTLDKAADAVFWVKRGGAIFYANDEACRSLGYTREELLTRSVLDIDPSETEENLSRGRTEPFVLTSEHTRKDGTTFPAEILVSPIQADGILFYCVFVRDLTERRTIEQQLQSAQRLESLGLLAGGLAHDFNNLLVSVTGNASILLDRFPADEPLRPLVEEVLEASERAALLTSQLLSYAGSGVVKLEYLDLSSEMESIARILESALPKGVELHIDAADALPSVRADAGQIQQISMNLVINAAEAMGSAPGEVRLRTASETLSAEAASRLEPLLERPAGIYVVIEVADRGCGMDADTRRRMFDPFFTNKETGRGLGLSAVLGNVRRLRGGVAIETEPGGGTTFRVYLPASDFEPSGVPDDAPRAAFVANQGRVLVADDEETVRRFARRCLEKFGFEVCEAEDGNVAVERFLKEGDSVVAVLLDVTMPGRNGPDTFRAMRAIREDIPIVLSSGYDEEKTASELAVSGHASFLRKPYRVDQLAEALREAITDSQDGAPLARQS